MANLVNLAVLRSAFDALTRTVQCVDDGELRKQCGTQFSDQVRKRTPSSDDTCTCMYQYLPSIKMDPVSVTCTIIQVKIVQASTEERLALGYTSIPITLT